MKKIKFYSAVNPHPPVITKNVNRIFKEYEKIKDVKVIDKENDIYEIVDKYVEKSSVDLEELTQSFKGQTGLEAVMKRVAITGDTSILNTISSDKEMPVVDATKLPKSLGEVKANADKISDLYNKLPDEIKAGKTAEEIAKDFTQQDLTNYINNLIKIKNENENVKGGNDNV